VTSGLLVSPRPSRAWRAWGRAALRGPIEAPTWQAVGYLLLSLPVAAVGFGVELGSMFVGILLALTFLGFPIIALGGLLAVRFGNLQRRLAADVLREKVPAPTPRAPLPGFFGWLQSRLTDPRDWRARLYLLIHFPLNLAAVYIVVVLSLEGLIGALYPILWQLSGPVQQYHGDGVLDVGFGFSTGAASEAGVPHRFTLHVGTALLDSWPRALATCAVGILVLLIVPWVVRGFARLDLVLVRALLGASDGSRRIKRLEAARGVMAEDAAATLRRIERDLHDGTQAQLVALAMNLGELKERLESDHGQTDEGLLELVATSHARAKEALVELRSIAGGIHPPALDLGLDHALATLASRSVVPALLRAELPTRPSDAVATIAYYSVAELLANVAKHSGATSATITVSERAGRLYLTVADDGRGGADPANGTGIQGLSARLAAVDGSLAVHSPPGGPTVVTAELPLRI
ncbi:MAG: sensor domain-containing protein, partial [Acidimicrobiaceae bacterium]|nr:sensor domain-containing protein [Acidimicrobiaceae bacterium]